MSVTSSACLAVAALFLSTSCIGAFGGGSAGNGDDPQKQGEGLSYYRDVLPVIQAKCAGCHSEGGPGGFDLEKYEVAKRFSASMASATATGRMPPWPPSATCGDFLGKDTRTLTAAEAQLFSDWDTAGAPAGDPASAPGPRQPAVMDTPDLVLDPGEYTFANNQSDLYQCFDLPSSGAIDMIGADVIPGNRATVHHVLLFRQIGGGGGGQVGAPGYECSGVPPNSEILAGWSPGAQGLRFPDGAGMQIAAADKLIMQIHYHAVAGAGPQLDRTRIHLFTAKAALTDLVRVVWLGSALIQIGAGAQGVTSGLCEVPANSGPVKVLSASPHMHTLGTSAKSTVLHPNGTQTCMIDIPRWDFEWQGGYAYREPMVLQPGDQIQTTCNFNNQTQNTVSFGEGTGDEMCFNFVFVIGGDLPQLCFPPCNTGGCGF